MNDNIVELVGHVLSFLSGTFLKAWWDHRLKKKEEKKTSEMVWNLENLAEVHRQMENVISKTQASRFLILKGSNGGSVPKPGSDFYVSVIHQVHRNKDYDDLAERYHRVKTDSAYVEMLLDAMRNNVVPYVVNDMKPCLLKNIYKSEGIEYAEIYLIAQSKTELFYASVGTTDPGEKFEDEKQRVAIDLAINGIRNIFSMYKR